MYAILNTILLPQTNYRNIGAKKQKSLPIRLKLKRIPENVAGHLKKSKTNFKSFPIRIL
jgi:hypothetical protein